MNAVISIKNTVYRNFPEGLVNALSGVNFEKIEEIRIRAEKPVIVKLGLNEIVLKYIVHIDEILSILDSNKPIIADTLPLTIPHISPITSLHIDDILLSFFIK